MPITSVFIYQTEVSILHSCSFIYSLLIVHIAILYYLLGNYIMQYSLYLPNWMILHYLLVLILFAHTLSFYKLWTLGSKLTSKKKITQQASL